MKEDNVDASAAISQFQIRVRPGDEPLALDGVVLSALQEVNRPLVEQLKRNGHFRCGPPLIVAPCRDGQSRAVISGHEALIARRETTPGAVLAPHDYCVVDAIEDDPRLVAFVAAHQTSQKRFAPFDWAQLLREASRRGLSQKDAADACGFTNDRSLVSILQTLADVDHALPQRVRDELRKPDGRFGTGHFRAISSEFGAGGKLSSELTQLITRAAERGMSVTQLKAKVAKLRLARQAKLPALPVIAAPNYEVSTDRRPPITAEKLKARVEDALALCLGFYPDVAAHLSNATDVLEQLVEAERAKIEKARNENSENETNKE